MADYNKAKWSDTFPDRAGQEVRPTEAISNSLDYDVDFPQYLSDDPVVYNLQNKTISQLVSNDARLYERISAATADMNAHFKDPKAHANGIVGNAASAAKLQTGRKIHRVDFDGTQDITLPDFTGCSDTVSGQSGVVPSPAAGKTNTVLHSSGAWGKVTYADIDETAVKKIQECPFPVGAVYLSVDGTNPSKIWEGTTWAAFAMGRCLIGAGTADSGTIYAAGTKLGEEKHALTAKETGPHSHTASSGAAGEHTHTATTESAGGHTHTGTTGSAGNHGHSTSVSWSGSHYHGTFGDNYKNPYGLYDSNEKYGGSSGADWNNPTAKSSTDGNHTHTVTVNANGNHSHGFTTGSSGGHTHYLTTTKAANHSHSVTVDSACEGAAHNNMQPSIVVYIFQRTA